MSPKTQLFLLLALFLLPSSTQADEELLEDEDCVMKTSIVLRKLNECSISPSSSPVAATPMNAHLLENMAENTEKVIRKLLETQNQATMAQFVQMSNKLEQMEQTISGIAGKLEETEKTLDSVKKQVQENAKAINFILVDCKRLLRWPGVNKTNLFSADGKHFYANITAMFWYKAREWCVERGMQLATLKTLTQVEAVAKELYKIFKNSYGFWLSSSNICRKPRQFQWADGTPVDNSTWDLEQPNDFGAGKETCVYLSTRSNKLRDYSCSGTSYILCEVPTALSACV